MESMIQHDTTISQNYVLKLNHPAGPSPTTSHANREVITAERSKADAQQAQVEADSIRIEKEAKARIGRTLTRNDPDEQSSGSSGQS